MKKIDIKKMSIKDKVEFIRKNDKQMYDTLRDHDEKITSRRDFISHGLMGATSMALGSMIPFSNQAFAACDVKEAGGSVPIPFMTINGAGGPCYTKAVLPTNQDGSLLATSSYRIHNIGVGANPVEGQNVTRDHGAPMHTNSAFYLAMRNALGAENMQHVRAILIANTSSNDTAQDNNSIAGIIAKMNVGKLTGYVGSTGANGRARPLGRPDSLVPINNANAAAGLVAEGILGRHFPKNNGSFEKFLNFFTNTTKRSVASVDDQRMNALLKEKISCSMDNAKASLLTSDDPDPRNSQEVINAFGNNNSASQLAALSWLVGQGYAGSGIFQIGGCDYHRQDVDNRVRLRDTQLGEAFGRAARVSLELGRPFVAQFTSDGSAAARSNSPEGTGGFSQPQSDSRDVCSTIIIGCFPGNKPQNRRQPLLGAYRSSGVVDTAPAVSNKVGAQIAVLANYLALTGEEGKLASILADHGVANPIANINDILVWTKIT